jgi:hypothetical protein
MLWTVRLNIGATEPEQAHRRVHSPSVLWMIWSEKLLLQVHEGARDLDQALEEQVVVVAGL